MPGISPGLATCSAKTLPVGLLIWPKSYIFLKTELRAGESTVDKTLSWNAAARV